MTEDASAERVCGRFHAAIELIGARWTGAILRAVFTGRHRYGQIKAAVPGLSDTMLADRLRSMEAAGLVERRVIPSSPVQVEYHLTEMGRDLEPVLQAVIAWSHRWIPPPGEAGAEDAPARSSRPRRTPPG
jgi:DNA-binding HxlR family transcriptional regulator